MFTCIPHVLAVESITEALENYNELIERTPLQINEIMKLVKLCLESTTFQWRDNLNKLLEHQWVLQSRL